MAADGGQSRQVALTIEVSGSQARGVELTVVGNDGVMVTHGTATLVQQALTVQTVGGKETVFNRQFTVPLDATGRARFTNLATGDYNYTVTVEGYDRNSGSLRVVSGLGTQTEQIAMKPSPFKYTWTVVPIDQKYDVRLTLTYDTGSSKNRPSLFIAPRIGHSAVADLK